MDEIIVRFLGMWFLVISYPIVFLSFWGTVIGIFAGPALLLTKWTNTHYRHTKSGNEIYWGRVFAFLSIPWMFFIWPISLKAFSIGVDWYSLLIQGSSQIVIAMVIIGAALHYVVKKTDYVSQAVSRWIRWLNILLIVGFVGACIGILPSGDCYYEVGANGAVGRLC